MKNMKKKKKNNNNNNVLIKNNKYLNIWINDYDISFPITITKLIEKIEKHNKDNKFYEHFEENDLSISKLKVIKLFLKKNNYLKYTKKNNIIDINYDLII